MAAIDTPATMGDRAGGARRIPANSCLVVGYDGSDAARAALEYAAARSALRSGAADIVVVYGYGPPTDWLGTPNLQSIYESRRELGRTVLAGLPLAASHAIDLVAEPPARAIALAARRHDAAEIIVGGRGFGRLRGPLGSVSHELLCLADRPVVIVPPMVGVA